MRDQRSFMERLADEECDRLEIARSEDYSRHIAEKRKLERMCFVLLWAAESGTGPLVTHVEDNHGELLDVSEQLRLAKQYFAR